MVNIKPIIVKELEKVSDNINDCYPSDWSTFPVIQYVEEDNSIHTKINDEERLVYIRYKVDIWNDKSTSDIALAIDGVFSSLGFKRTQCLDAPEPKLRHKVMRFEAIIDVNNMRVYNP